jgi:hypothetical protein
MPTGTMALCSAQLILQAGLHGLPRSANPQTLSNQVVLWKSLLSASKLLKFTLWPLPVNDIPGLDLQLPWKKPHHEDTPVTLAGMESLI